MARLNSAEETALALYVLWTYFCAAVEALRPRPVLVDLYRTFIQTINNPTGCESAIDVLLIMEIPLGLHNFLGGGGGGRLQEGRHELTARELLSTPLLRVEALVPILKPCFLPSIYSSRVQQINRDTMTELRRRYQNEDRYLVLSMNASIYERHFSNADFLNLQELMEVRLSTVELAQIVSRELCHLKRLTKEALQAYDCTCYESLDEALANMLD